MDDPEHIYHWQRIDERLTTSGQPSEGELAEIAALGVRLVINLAPHSHAKALPDEAGCVGRLGMGYRNIPVDFQRPDEADFSAFCALMETHKGAPLHVHCAANYRVSAFVYRYRRDVLGADEGQARADLLRVWQPDAAWAAFLGWSAGLSTPPTSPRSPRSTRETGSQA